MSKPPRPATPEQLHDLGDVLLRLRNYHRGPRYLARFVDASVDAPLAVRNVVRAVELLGLEGEVCVGDVATRLAIEASSASRQVDVAVRLGLLEKRASDDDGRRLQLRLTGEGARLAAWWSRRRDEHLAEVLRAWSAAEVGQLLELGTRLADDIEALEQ